MLPCPGCKGLFPTSEGECFRYGTSSPGCWEAFTTLLGLEYDKFIPTHNRLIVDAYAVQHPQNIPLQKMKGINDRLIAASIQSVHGHLFALYCAFEKNLPYPTISSYMNKFLKQPAHAPFTPPENLGTVTIQDFQPTFSQQEYEGYAKKWALVSWNAWSLYHPIIKTWYEELDR